MDIKHNINPTESTHSDGSTSSISLDTCETTPLSPRTIDFDSVDLPNTAREKVDLVYAIKEHSKMAPTDSSRKQQKDGSWQWKISIIVAFTVFSVVLLIAVSVAMRYMQCTQESKEQRIMENYKSLFMTKGELDEMMKSMKKQKAMEKFSRVRQMPSADMPKYNCTPMGSGHKNATGEPSVQSVRASNGRILHGCCETSLRVRTFDFLPDMDGNFWRVVQFMDRYQYFFVEECNHIMDCSIPCTCMRQARHVTALVADDNFENERLTQVLYEGSCKCLNNGFH
ncbi:hypothetical protein EGW08_009730 [Elysia chlorotica]|uniref:Uncharacterized protein n=1 Tax=Elysia chlorotica TaxID=188477 RepID=A0A433TLY5_ELYCH|nr:hypothetical protein EGW08_009730 [Elysia chlorotica]